MKEISITLDDRLFALLQAVADDQETSVDEIVARALEPYLRAWAPPGRDDPP